MLEATKNFTRSKLVIFLIVGFLALFTYLLITVSRQLADSSISTSTQAAYQTGYADRKAKEMMARGFGQGSGGNGSCGARVELENFDEKTFLATAAYIRCSNGVTCKVAGTQDDPSARIDKTDWSDFAQWECCSNPKPCSSKHFSADYDTQ